MPLKGTVSNPTTRDIKAHVAHMPVGKPILLSHVVSLVAYEIIKQGHCKSKAPFNFHRIETDLRGQAVAQTTPETLQ